MLLVLFPLALTMFALFNASRVFFFSDQLEVDGRRFVVRERIGEGGFSTVDLVQDRNTRVS